MIEKRYVIMVDTFMSGWGKAEGKDNVLIFECDSEEEAKIVHDNALARGDMEKVKILKRLPILGLDEQKMYVQHINKCVYPSWYKEGFWSEYAGSR